MRTKSVEIATEFALSAGLLVNISLQISGFVPYNKTYEPCYLHKIYAEYHTCHIPRWGTKPPIFKNSTIKASFLPINII
jgi:hypothetical protein